VAVGRDEQSKSVLVAVGAGRGEQAALRAWLAEIRERLWWLKSNGRHYYLISDYLMPYAYQEVWGLGARSTRTLSPLSAASRTSWIATNVLLLA
jgi:hypothetical protein